MSDHHNQDLEPQHYVFEFLNWKLKSQRTSQVSESQDLRSRPLYSRVTIYNFKLLSYDFETMTLILRLLDVRLLIFVARIS